MRTNEKRFSSLLYFLFLLLFGLVLNSFFQWFFSNQFDGGQAVLTNGQFYFAAICSQLFIFFLPTVIWLKWMKLPLVKTRSSSPKLWLQLVKVICLFILVYGLNNIFLYFINSIESLRWIQEIQNTQTVFYASIFGKESQILIAILVVAIVPAFVEELFFRRLLFAYFSEKNKRFWRPAIFSSLLFAFVHFQPALFPAMFAFAMLFTYLYHLSGSIWLGSMLHAGNNVFQLLQIHFNWQISDHVLYIVCAFSLAIAFMISFFLKSLKKS